MSGILDPYAVFPSPAPPSGGFVRGLPHTYEVTAFGGVVSTVPAAGWERGQVLRQNVPEVRLGPATPMYDASDPNAVAAGWTRATS